MFNAKIIVCLFLFLIIVRSAYAQLEEDFMMDDEEMEMEKEMETKKIDSKIGLWKLNGFGAFQDSVKRDTLIDHIHSYHPAYKNALTNTYVGNYGTPYLNNDFFGRESDLNFFFLRSREAYMLTPEAVEYYNTTTPYTVLDFSQSENKSRKNETRFNVLHTQNASPNLNFTFRFDQAKSMGQYNYQESTNNFVTLYSSYNKDNVSIHSGFISNAIKNMENGGLENENDLFDTDKTEILNVNLSKSRSHFNSSYFFTNAEYKLGKFEPVNDTTEVFRPIIGIIYSAKYERHKQEFMEEESIDSLFFDNTYYEEDYIKDSIRFNVLTNIIQLKQYENKFRKTSFGKRAFLGYEIARGSNPGINGEVLYRDEIKYSNLYVGGGIFRKESKFWTWNFEGKFYLLGRNLGQTELNGILAKPMRFMGDSLAALVLEGAIDNRIADPFQEKFSSNHARWDNDLKAEQMMRAGGKFVSGKRKLEIGGKYAIITNYIYNDTLGIPTQTNKELIILSAFLDKDFNYRNLHFRTRLLWQKASNQDLIHLPDFSCYVSAYFKFVISKVLFTQLGVDTRYNTSYYADAYAPNTGMFHLQNDKKYGNFPYMDAYANLRLKRTKVFFKMMNVGAKFIDRPYFTSPSYPMNKTTFRLGVNWTFYD